MAHLAQPNKPFSYDDASLVDKMLAQIEASSWDAHSTIIEDDGAFEMNTKMPNGMTDSSRSLKSDEGLMTPRARIVKGGALFSSFKNAKDTISLGIPTIQESEQSYLVFKGILA